MKTKLLLLLLLTNFVYSQVTDVLTNYNSAGISNLTYKDNFIYFNSYVEKKIYRFDYTQTNPTVELVYQFSENPNFVFVKNDILYVGVENPYQTYKINLASDNFYTTPVANVAGPMVQINDDDLYIGQYAASKIVKVNLTTLQQSDVLVGYKPNFFTVYNNKLFFTSNYTNALYKYDASTGNLDTVLNNLNYASGIVMNDTSFYICESAASSISWYTNPDFQFESMVQLPANSWPNGSIIIDNELFFVQTIAGKISKMTINTTLSTTHFANQESKIMIYPNPSSDTIKVESLYAFDTYQIYDMQGKLIENKEMNNNSINISNLSKGKYILALDKMRHSFIKN